MNLYLRLTKPEKRTQKITIPTCESTQVCLKDLSCLACQNLGFQPEDSDRVRFSLNNKDILSGDDVPLSDLGIVNGDLIYVHVPEDHLLKMAMPTSCQNRQPSPQQADITEHDDTDKTDYITTPEKGTPSADAIDPYKQEGAITSQPTGCVRVNDVEEFDVKEVNRYLKMAVLIRESDGDDIPQSLRIVLEEEQPFTEHQVLFLVLHVLVLETGFVYEVPEHGLLPKHETISKFMLNYHCRGESQKSFSLVAVPMGKTLLVHAVSHDAEAVRYNLTLKPQYYITISDTGFQFKNLPQLSREVKDKVSYPMLQYLTNDDGNSVLSLIGMLYEVKILILMYLDVHPLLKLSETCSLYNELCKKPVLWHRLFVKDFGKSKAADKDLKSDWLQLYKEQYLQRKRLHEEMRAAYVVIPDVYLPARPPPWVPPFMFGGDYDRLPGPMLPGSGGPTFPQAPRYDPTRPLMPDLIGEPNPFRTPRFGPYQSSQTKQAKNNRSFRVPFGSQNFF